MILASKEQAVMDQQQATGLTLRERKCSSTKSLEQIMIW